MRGEPVRVMMGLYLTVELYDVKDSASSRLAVESSLVERAANILEQIAVAGQALLGLDPQGRTFTEITAGSGKRPTFTLGPISPEKWSAHFTGFRRSDDIEVTFSARYLPIPLTAIAAMTCRAVITDVPSLLRERGLEAGSTYVPTLDPDLGNCDFSGIGTEPRLSVNSTGEPVIHVKFLDWMGIIANTKVKPGHAFDDTLPISQSIAGFLKGTVAEGMPVVWTDPDEEPSLGKLKPELFKKPKGKGAHKAPTKSDQSYADAIATATHAVGCIARVRLDRMEVAFAGTFYDGVTRSGETSKFTFMIGNGVVESIEQTHKLVGAKTQSVQVIAYNPDTHRQYVARWPPDPKSLKAVQLDPAQPARLPPLIANVGIPGLEHFDESIASIPIGPVSDPAMLPRVAQSIFLERSRQKSKFVLKMHSSTSDPFAPEPHKGDVLRLRAGDVVRLGIRLRDPDGAEAMPSVLYALSGQLSQGEIKNLLVESGVEAKQATKMSVAIASIPVTDRLRVDSFEVSGGVDVDAEMTVTLSTFVVIDIDLANAAKKEKPADVVTRIKALSPILPALSLEEIRKRIDAARNAVVESGATDSEIDAALDEIDIAEQVAMRHK